MNKLVWYFFILLCLWFGCSTRKKNIQKSSLQGAPEWVKRTPSHPAYYHGIGSAYKAGQPDFREKARQMALSEIASSISVNISAHSILIQMEADKNFSEFFKEQVRLTTQQLLEGYELVDSWENENQYWVYYRLSKSTWHQIQQDRIRKALTLSNEKFQQAIKFSNEGNHADALRFLILALEDIRNYLGEDLRIQTSSTDESYATQLLRTLVDQLQSIKIIYPTAKFQLKPRIAGANPTLVAVLNDHLHRPVARIPVLVRYSWLPGSLVQLTSDALGKIYITMERPEKYHGTFQISSQLNWNKMVRENSTDPTIRQLLEGFQMTRYNLPVEIIPPQVRITLSGNFDQSLPFLTAINTEMEKIFLQDGIGIADSEKDSDLNIRLQITLGDITEKNNRYLSVMETLVTVANSEGKTLYHKILKDLQGIGSNRQHALEDALRALVTRFQIVVYPEIRQEIL